MEKQILNTISHESNTYFRWVKEGRVTRRQQKREMLLSFIDNAKKSKRNRTSSPSLLKALLGLFV
jgi:hypothetical protein